jgi:hypothetical protein
MTKMPDSIDPTELLAHANPITTYEIDPARLTQMINRVTSTPVPSRFPLLRTWQMKAGSAVAGAALVATGVLVAISGAPQSLAVLALPSNTAIAGPVAHTPATLGPVVFESTQVPTVTGSAATAFRTYVAGPRLSTSGVSLRIYKVKWVKNPQTKVLRIAGALNVRDASPVLGVSSSPPDTWIAKGANALVVVAPYVGSSTRPTVSISSPGPLTWTYNVAGPCPQPSTLSLGVVPTSCPMASDFSDHNASHAELTSWSTPFATKLVTSDLVPGGMTLAPPRFTGTNNIVYYPLRTSNAVTTNQYLEFQFSNQGKLIYATGLLGSVSPGKNYPVIAEADGAGLLSNPSLSGINPGGPMIPAPSKKVSGSGVAVALTLKSATLTYELVSLTNGSAVLVPQYTYAASDGTALQVLALNPSYYRINTAK